MKRTTLNGRHYLLFSRMFLLHLFSRDAPGSTLWAHSVA